MCVCGGGGGGGGGGEELFFLPTSSYKNRVPEAIVGPTKTAPDITLLESVP